MPSPASGQVASTSQRTAPSPTSCPCSGGAAEPSTSGASPRSILEHLIGVAADDEDAVLAAIVGLRPVLLKIFGGQPHGQIPQKTTSPRW